MQKCMAYFGTLLAMRITIFSLAAFAAALWLSVGTVVYSWIHHGL